MNINLIEIRYLEKTPENIKIVEDLILKDVSGKCFSNKDINGNIIPISEMASIYLEYTKMYGILYENNYIGLLSLTNENEISFFIEPCYQGKGIAKYSLKLFEEMLIQDYHLNSIVAEITLDNVQAINLVKKIGFLETDEIREVPINSTLIKVKKYIKSI